MVTSETASGKSPDSAHLTYVGHASRVAVL